MSPRTKTPVVSTDEWATPQWLFDHFDAEFAFTLDAAAQPWNAKCGNHFSVGGIERPWRGRSVWLNPPYSNIGPWLAKAHAESQDDLTTVVCLLPCVPDRKWWSEGVEGKAAEIRHLTRSLLPSGRVHFEREDGSSDRAPFASCLIVYRRVS